MAAYDEEHYFRISLLHDACSKADRCSEIDIFAFITFGYHRHTASS